MQVDWEPDDRLPKPANAQVLEQMSCSTCVSWDLSPSAVLVVAQFRHYINMILISMQGHTYGSVKLLTCWRNWS